MPAFDGAEDGEEFQCAQALDRLEEVRFWLRSVARDPASFWLPTASDRFYPDFVAQLEDGRLLVAEYKGERDIASDDTREKQTVGALWERRSGGRCLFIVVQRNNAGKDMQAQLATRSPSSRASVRRPGFASPQPDRPVRSRAPHGME